MSRSATTTISAASDTARPSESKSSELQLGLSSVAQTARTTSDDLAGIEELYLASDQSISPVSLPPVDGGRQAWAYVICATILETLVWGMFFAHGSYDGTV